MLLTAAGGQGKRGPAPRRAAPSEMGSGSTSTRRKGRQVAPRGGRMSPANLPEWQRKQLEQLGEPEPVKRPRGQAPRVP